MLARPGPVRPLYARLTARHVVLFASQAEVNLLLAEREGMRKLLEVERMERPQAESERLQLEHELPRARIANARG